MDSMDTRVEELQEALSAINLQSCPEQKGSNGKRLLLEKILAARVYRRYTINEIIMKMWGPRNRVQIDNLGQNVFKFVFANQTDREKRDFQGRPWSINDANLILKEWSEKLAIHKVPFDTTAFTIQIHGLPLMFLHTSSAKLIGNRVGIVHENTISNKTVVGHRYLRFKVDIEVGKPVPAGYFIGRKGDDESWVQFKFERLGDFCYKCRMLDHVTGRCSFAKPATITSWDGATTQLYGPWIRVEHGGDLLFVNTLEVDAVNREADERGFFFEIAT